ncbi:hypothetical protein KIH31_03520 [Paenarthrobacter sp. DKR-5]|uniref:alpha/beta fold hydrolase n=1 Tax=Paenarthrobacter sp. DKR-5 TaxID=2835535 RepID=UPI001BDCAD6C|nr:hypothetical protein [Paenarthrobacter sp. DKR-5]MBT1001663.1 hypothetical protein [Paenarthrobacter sp. DKR-5]
MTRPDPDRQPEGTSVLSGPRHFAATDGRELTVGGVRWRYTRLGSGPPVLRLTGGLRRAALGFAFLEQLAAHNTVGAPDYPPVRSFADLDTGLSAILRAEGIDRCDLGQAGHAAVLLEPGAYMQWVEQALA